MKNKLLVNFAWFELKQHSFLAQIRLFLSYKFDLNELEKSSFVLGKTAILPFN